MKNTNEVILVQKVLTNTSHVISCIVMLKDVIKVSLLQKGKNDRIKNIVSVFYAIQCSLNKFKLSATIMTTSSSDHNTSASKTVGLVHTLVRKTFPTPAVHTITSIAKTK
jgi:predicted type IV restriction endonuclease